MDRLQIEKNRLDLAYRKQLQILSGIILLATTGLLSFVGTFVWKPELIMRGIFFSSFIVLICLIAYFSVDTQMRAISEELRRLS